MVNKTTIEKNLKHIDNLYNKHIGDKEAVYYCKLAILEICGWIEETMDDIVRSCANKHLKDPSSITIIEEIIQNTHSFKYRDNFRNMLKQLIGLINLENLENMFDGTKFPVMESSLGALKQSRDDLAHTYIKGTTTTINAPSFSINHFKYVYQGLKDIEKCLRAI